VTRPRLGFLGVGWIGRHRMLSVLEHGGADVVAIADPSAERRAAAVGVAPAAAAYETLSHLLELPLDGIVIATPSALHAEQAIACLRQGVSVLCEKPPALSLAELDAIAAAEGPAWFATVFQHRFGSGAQRLRRLVARGELGRPLAAVCHTLWYRPDDYFAVPWRGRWEVEGGGPTMGHGIHQMDLLLHVLGPWREVVAVAARQARPTATEDLSCAIVTFANGAVASIVNSLLAPRETSYLRVDFASATVELAHLYGYHDGDWTVTAAAGYEEAVAAAWAQGPAGTPSGHAAQLAAVLDALESGGSPPVRLPEARATLELVAVTYASAFTGRRVGRGEIGPGDPFYARMDGTGAPWS